MAETAKVSVFCLTYNHEQYLRRCLDGFVMQKTNFPFEVLVHDDASTDGTANIIREYAEKYPEIIKPTYQMENQYSKGVKIIHAHLLSKAQGMYFAWCEGDDYWTDENKLQKQIAFLDEHPEYSCCYHRVLRKNLADGSTSYVPNIAESREFGIEEIIRGGAVFQLSSLVIRSNIYRERPASFAAKKFGDVTTFLYGAIRGKCFVLSDAMSVYNHGTVGSYTNRMKAASVQSRIEHEQDYITLLEKANALSNYQYESAFSYAIDRLQCNIYILSGDKKKARSGKYRPFYKQYKKQQRVYFVRKYLPFLSKVKRLLKRGQSAK